MKEEVKHIISQLKKGKIGLSDISEEYKSDLNIIQAERTFGLRVVIRCGYDVIKDSFFVEEKVHNRKETNNDVNIHWTNNSPQLFDDFDTYFSYLNGNIYDNACYYLMSPMKVTQNVDQNKLYQRKSFIEDTIDDYCIITRDSDYIDEEIKKTQLTNGTLLPANNEQLLKYNVEKYYYNGKFNVLQEWKDQNGSVVRKYEHEFDYFCDFVAFLNGDLTDADLISCDGLEYVAPNDEIDLHNAYITSNICEKWGIAYEKYKITASEESSFSFSEQNEIEADMVLQPPRNVITNENNDGYQTFLERYDSPLERIYYISDIHLSHLLHNKNAKSFPDIVKIIREVVSTIIKESHRDSIILINGDTSLDFSIFQYFASELGCYYRTVVFTIGNHDIWSCPDDTIDQLTEKYRTFLQEKKMYLLQNDILYFNEFWQPPERISEEETYNSTVAELRDRTKTARLILFGGVGFAGYNQFYNAEIGLYRYNNTIGFNRDIELKETQRFEMLYKKVSSALYDKSVVIMTHMPLPDWYELAWKHRSEDYAKDSCGEAEYHTDRSDDNVGAYSVYQPGFIYLSGHTHKNYYYDDGVIRIYADNQFGYKKSSPSSWPHLKYFEVEKAIDVFADYADGIYVITADEYRSFNRGKNIRMDFNRDTNIIFMLKKSEHYCFIHKAKDKKLSIMNGGALRRLDSKDINYYYENMDLVISLIKDPLDKYTEYQKKVSEEIKRLGGEGIIHGCIIDIDFYNHVYVNPNDGTITGYWASDIINKLVYPTIPALLEAQCPRLFAIYNAMLNGEEKNNLTTISGQQSSQVALAPVPYLDTDIYKASRQIKKMQKLNSNILSTWPDRLPQNNLITE